MKNFSLFISKVVTSASTVAFNIYLARIAGVEYFGIFSLFLNLTFIFGLLADWGLSVYGPLELNSCTSAEEKHKYISSVFNFRLGITMLSAVIYTAVILIFYPAYFGLLIFGVLVLAGNILNLDWVLRAHGKFGIVSFRLIFNAIVNLVLAAVIYYLDADVMYLFLSYCVSLALSFGLSTFYMYRHRIWKYEASPVRQVWHDGRNIIRKTRSAFKAVLISNLVYSLSIPLLTLFASATSSSLYASYYTLFSTVVALVIITQDLFIPRYRRESEKQFFSSYGKVIYSGSICILLALVAIKYYYHLIFPETFLLNLTTIQLVALLGFVHGYRLMHIHRFMIRGEYRSYLNYNVFSLLLFLVSTAVFIGTGNYNENTAFASLLMAEVICIARAVSAEKTADRGMFANLLFAGVIIIFSSFFYDHYVLYGVILLMLGIMLLVFYRRLEATLNYL